MAKPLDAWKELTTSSAQVLVCDLQQQIVARSKTTPPAELSRSAQVLCQLARLFRLPLTLSVVPEGEAAPELIPELQPFAEADNQFLRANASPWLDAKTRKHLDKQKRPVLLLAGFANEVVVLHAALGALDEGYGVIVIVDACGGMSASTESAALEHIRGAGGLISSVVSVATALSPDFTTAEGQEMFKLVQALRLA